VCQYLMIWMNDCREKNLWVWVLNSWSCLHPLLRDSLFEPMTYELFKMFGGFAPLQSTRLLSRCYSGCIMYCTVMEKIRIPWWKILDTASLIHWNIPSSNLRVRDRSYFASKASGPVKRERTDFYFEIFVYRLQGRKMLLKGMDSKYRLPNHVIRSRYQSFSRAMESHHSGSLLL
jgi:hypothetical protein